MTNETTASQPKSIGDDAGFIEAIQAYNRAEASHPRMNAYRSLVSFIDNFRAPADQASATIQAAPEVISPERVTEIWSKVADEFQLALRHAIDPADAGNLTVHFARAVERYVRSAATIQEPVMVAAEPVEEELHFNAQRLRNVAVLVGLTGAIPDDDVTLDGARGAVLGMIAGRLRGEAKIDALVAPMVAEPVGAARCSACEGIGSYEHKGADTCCRVCGGTGLAATVKAVPSEALDAFAYFVQPSGFGPFIECSAQQPGSFVAYRAVKIAAPLADKTGGGE